MNEWIVLFIVFDVIVTTAVILFVLKRRARMQGAALATGSPIATLAQFREFAAFARDQHERIGEYLRANWSGIPDQLPAVLGALLDKLQSEAAAKNLTVDRDMLKTMVATSLRHHRIAKANDVGNALERVA
jgi:hypothetical protein